MENKLVEARVQGILQETEEEREANTIKKSKTANNLIKMGMPLTTVAEVMEISIDELKVLLEMK